MPQHLFKHLLALNVVAVLVIACGGRATTSDDPAGPAPQSGQPSTDMTSQPDDASRPEPPAAVTPTPPPADDTCAGITPPSFPSKFDAACAGNVGCSAPDPAWVGCECALCLDEQCVETICTEPPPPPVCPEVQPTGPTACSTENEGWPGCEYAISPCPCGPSPESTVCTCVSGAWDCVAYTGCYPCS